MTTMSGPHTEGLPLTPMNLRATSSAKRADEEFKAHHAPVYARLAELVEEMHRRVDAVVQDAQGADGVAAPNVAAKLRGAWEECAATLSILGIR